MVENPLPAILAASDLICSGVLHDPVLVYGVYVIARFCLDDIEDCSELGGARTIGAPAKLGSSDTYRSCGTQRLLAACNGMLAAVAIDMSDRHTAVAEIGEGRRMVAVLFVRHRSDLVCSCCKDVSDYQLTLEIPAAVCIQVWPDYSIFDKVVNKASRSREMKVDSR